MRDNPTICRAINLPVQSGSDRILREMNRGYTSGQYLELVDRIKAALPDVSLTTDLIVGFPGETEEDFRDSYRLLETVKFDIVHTAAYSPREGTRAAVMDGQIDNRVKAARPQRDERAPGVDRARLERTVRRPRLRDTRRRLGSARRGQDTGAHDDRQGRHNPRRRIRFRQDIPVTITRASHWSLEGERRTQ